MQIYLDARSSWKDNRVIRRKQPHNKHMQCAPFGRRTGLAADRC